MNKCSTVFLSLFLASLASCQTSPKANIAVRHAVDFRDTLKVGDTLDAEHDRIYGEDDTTILFNKVGRLVAVIIPKTDAKYFKSFQTFIDRHSSDTLGSYGCEVEDVTGDGIKDSCITEIRLIMNCPVVEHRVISKGRQVWFDTLTIKDEQAENLFWSEDSASYHELEPFSSLFIAEQSFGKFVGDSVNEGDASYFLNVLHHDNVEYWRKYIQDFKARWIWYMDVVDAGGMIWDKKTQKFIEYWGP